MLVRHDRALKSYKSQQNLQERTKDDIDQLQLTFVNALKSNCRNSSAKKLVFNNNNNIVYQRVNKQEQQIISDEELMNNKKMNAD